MTDERYEFIQDCKEKASTARSSKNKRTHCGKGGNVRFPSDNLTKKEREAMNSECKTYRMNDPVKWSEFKTWPKEHQITYIKLLREKFGVPDSCIGAMMGISKSPISHLVTKLGIGVGYKHNSRKVWDKDGFYAWCGGIKEEVVKPVVEEVEPEPELEAMHDVFVDVSMVDKGHIVKNINDPVIVDKAETKTVVPDYGNMSFRGNVDDILRTVSNLLNGELVRLEVKWEVLD